MVLLEIQLYIHENKCLSVSITGQVLQQESEYPTIDAFFSVTNKLSGFLQSSPPLLSYQFWKWYIVLAYHFVLVLLDPPVFLYNSQASIDSVPKCVLRFSLSLYHQFLCALNSLKYSELNSQAVKRTKNVPITSKTADHQMQSSDGAICEERASCTGTAIRNCPTC